jgi:hypothetical protein
MQSGFSNLRSALPMNLKARRLGFKVWSGASLHIRSVVAHRPQSAESGHYGEPDRR